MKKTFLFLMIVSLFMSASSTSFAALFFKMTANKTTLTVGETATIELFAFADDPLAVGQNGLNSWQLSMLVSGDSAVTVVNGSIASTSPFANDLLNNGVNNPAGSIRNLAMNSKSSPVNSSLAVGDYTKIAEFMIEGVSVGRVTYSIGDAGGGFFGVLRDFNPMNPTTWGNNLNGSFNAAGSDRVFTVVPEPATFAMLGGMGLLLLRGRKSGRL